MAASESRTCCRNGICSLTQLVSTPRVATQPGSVGSTVSNGVSTAEDFHGNRTSGAIQTVVFP
jgi:hypothetical protein